MVRVLDLFAGPGGVDEGLRMIGITDVVGVEWDADACATAEAAGHERVQADVAELDPADYPCDGLWASPPCQAWSMAGKRQAVVDQERCHRHAMACTDGWVPYDPADYADARTPLVHEPLRWAWALRPGWVALEQVPPVVDYWRTVAHVLRVWGYHVWTGVLNSADFGVPQTRRRAILMARRDGPVEPPEPTHAERSEPALFGGGRQPWVTMAEALAWGASDIPSPTVTGGGSTTGGAEVYGRRSRVMLASLRDGPAWVDGHGERPNRVVDEPAPSIHFGHRANDVKWHWGHDMPATTIAGDPRMTGRAHHNEGEQGRDAVDVSEALSDGADPGRSVRVTVEQAATLQGFPADYPWQGSKTSRFAQVGNAVPPQLAAAIVSALIKEDA